MHFLTYAGTILELEINTRMIVVNIPSVLCASFFVVCYLLGTRPSSYGSDIVRVEIANDEIVTYFQ